MEYILQWQQAGAILVWKTHYLSIRLTTMTMMTTNKWAIEHNPFSWARCPHPTKGGCEEIEMQTRQHEKSGPETSYDETTPLLEERLKDLRDKDIERRLNASRNPNTGLLDMSKTDLQTNISSEEDEQKEIQRVKALIKARYPLVKVDKLMIRFSKRNLNQRVVEGPKGGETKIALDDGSSLRQDF